MAYRARSQQDIIRRFENKVNYLYDRIISMNMYTSSQRQIIEELLEGTHELRTLFGSIEFNKDAVLEREKYLDERLRMIWKMMTQIITKKRAKDQIFSVGGDGFKFNLKHMIPNERYRFEFEDSVYEAMKNDGGELVLMEVG